MHQEFSYLSRSNFLFEIEFPHLESGTKITSLMYVVTLYLYQSADQDKFALYQTH